MNYEVVTIQDCIEMMQYKSCGVILSNGHVDGFEAER